MLRIRLPPTLDEMGCHTAAAALNAELNPKQIRLQFHISVFVGPEIQGYGCEFVDHRHRETILCEVDCLDVMAARIASFNANVVEQRRCINRELIDSFFSARGADESSAGPLS
jgi:hypothetical protein